MDPPPGNPPAPDATPPLLPRVARGDADAVSACLERYSGLVWSLARRALGRTADAEDLVQEVFIELWQKADMFDPTRGKEATFIAVLTRRRVIDKLRRQRARPDGRPAPLPESPSADPSAAAPPAALELHDEVRRVNAVLDRFDPPQPAVLRMVVCDGLTHQQVADRMELPLGTVKSQVRRGLIRLREALAPARAEGVTP